VPVCVRILLSFLLLLTLGLGAHAFMAATYTLDRWELEQTPAELALKHNLAIDFSNVDARGVRTQGLLVLRLESKDCLMPFCRTVIIRECASPPCQHITILAAPRFTPANPAIGFVPGAFSLVFEGVGKKALFVVVAPAFLMVSTLF
jgi:hypothetical protein